MVKPSPTEFVNIQGKLIKTLLNVSYLLSAFKTTCSQTQLKILNCNYMREK